MPNTLTPTLVHYLGDEKLVVDHPHGRNNKNQNVYKRSKPSKLGSIKELTKSTNASAVYKSNQANCRNLKQAQNARYESNKSKNQDTCTWRVFSSIAINSGRYKEMFSKILPDFETVFIINENVAKQDDGINCGLFALANALALVQGQNPVLFDWDKYEKKTGKDVMRAHYRTCMEMKKIVQFPSKPRRICRIKSIIPMPLDLKE